MGYVVSRETMNAAIQKHQVPRPSLENILNEAIDAEIDQGNLCKCVGCDCEAAVEQVVASDSVEESEEAEDVEDDTDAMGYGSPFAQ